jgi:hypothetical protein
MKRFSAALALFCLISVWCFAQTQTGNASYNASKKGLTLAHASMSFGTPVKIHNEENNREVIALVDGRIPPSDPRVADISKEAGDAIGMALTGYTRVRLEELLPEPAAAAPAPPAPEPPPPAPRPPNPPAPSPAPPPREVPVETIQVVSPSPAPVSYIMIPSPEGQNCSPLGTVILVLLIIAVLLLGAILVLLLAARRPWWPWRPWYYPVWLRRHLRYLKKRRY